QGSLFPILVLKALDSVPLHQADQAVAMTSSFTFLGQFLSPVVLDGIGKLANTDNIRFQYGTLSVVIMVVVFISTFAIIRSTKRLPQQINIDEIKNVRPGSIHPSLTLLSFRT